VREEVEQLKTTGIGLTSELATEWSQAGEAHEIGVVSMGTEPHGTVGRIPFSHVRGEIPEPPVWIGLGMNWVTGCRRSSGDTHIVSHG
jgi:hypothetical protein